MQRQLIRKRHKRKSKRNTVYKKGYGKGAVCLETKVCKKCGIEKELNEFQKDRTRKSGYRTPCKVCISSRKKLRKEGRKEGREESQIVIEKIVIEGIEYIGELKTNVANTNYLEVSNFIVAKVCSKCNCWKTIEEGFSKHKCGVGGTRSYCRECDRNVLAKWKKNNPEKVSGWYANNRERAIENNRIWWEANKELRKEYARTWLKNNPEARRAYEQRKRAAQKALPKEFTSEQSKKLKELFPVCPLTGSEDVHLEHWTPLAWGNGEGTSVRNLYYLDASLNLSKSGRNPFEFFIRPDVWKRINKRAFLDLVAYLAAANKMNVTEFIAYVYFCDINRKTDEEIEGYNARGEKVDSRSEFEAVKAEYMPYAEYLNEEHFKTLYNEV